MHIRKYCPGYYVYIAFYCLGELARKVLTCYLPKIYLRYILARSWRDSRSLTVASAYGDGFLHTNSVISTNTPVHSRPDDEYKV